MNWPIPSITLSPNAMSWLEEYIGPVSKIPDIGGNARMNSQAIIVGDKAYLTFGALSVSNYCGPAINDFTGRDT